eukprot:m.226443 g.226443  ORF g.226443 m.226443 type:complete len:1034 (+) comp15965_c0_seq3:1748-4849(+)
MPKPHQHRKAPGSNETKQNCKGVSQHVESAGKYRPPRKHQSATNESTETAERKGNYSSSNVHNCAKERNSTPRHHFQQLVAEVSSKQRYPELQASLDALAEMTYPVDGLTPREAVSSLLQLCSVRIESHPLCAIWFNIVRSLVHGHRLDLEADIVDRILSKMISRYPGVSTLNEGSRTNALWAIGAVLFGAGSKCSDSTLHNLIGNNGILIHEGMVGNKNMESRRAAIHCLGSLCDGMPEKKKERMSTLETALPIILNLTIQNLKESHSNDNPMRVKFLFTALTTLRFVIGRFQQLNATQATDTLAVIKMFCIYNITEQPARAFPTYDPLSRLMHTGNTGSKARTSSARDNSSESEFSDFPSGEDRVSRRPSGKVRSASLQALQTVIRRVPKQIMLGYWNSFLMDASDAPSLFALLKQGNGRKERAGTVNVLIDLFDGSKQYLSAAQETGSKATFTSYSSSLAALLRHVHSEILAHAKLEMDPIILAKIIQCLSVLIANTTFSRFLPGILSDIVEFIEPHISNENEEVQVAALRCCGIIFRVDDAPQVDVQKVFKESISMPNNLSSLVLLKVNSEEVNVQVAAESLRALSSLSNAHVLPETWYWNRMLDTAIRFAKRDNEDQRTAAVMLLGCLGKALENYVTPTSFEVQMLFWKRLEGILSDLLQEESPTVRASACDCASYIQKDCFAALDKHQRILWQTQILGLTSKTEPSTVKAAASRALGVYVLYPELREDVLFVMDVATSLIEVTQDKSLITRVKASWALGNLADSLVVRHKENNADAVPPRLFYQLFNAALVITKDNDKVKSNGMRALGGLGRIMNRELLETQDGKGTILQISKILIKYAESGAVKVRWNACRGLGLILQNEDFNSAPVWMEDVVETLRRVIEKASNFKVRINAAQALSYPSRRFFYGDSVAFAGIIKTLITSLQTLDTMDDFSEFRYQDTLKKQLQQTLLHIASLACVEGDMSDSPQVSEQLSKLDIPSLKATLAECVTESLPELDSINEDGNPGLKANLDRSMYPPVLQAWCLVTS